MGVKGNELVLFKKKKKKRTFFRCQFVFENKMAKIIYSKCNWHNKHQSFNGYIVKLVYAVCETDSALLIKKLPGFKGIQRLQPVVKYCRRYMSEDEFRPHPGPIIRRLILILSSHLFLGLLSDILFHVLRPKLRMNLNLIQVSYQSHPALPN
jgi:hypothetical protein